MWRMELLAEQKRQKRTRVLNYHKVFVSGNTNKVSYIIPHH